MATLEHNIDPISERLGHLDGRLDGIEKRLDLFERIVFRMIGGLYVLVTLGFSALGWLIVHRGG